ncbi:hypothetical protein GBAR_LOCUS15935 [Geodia barretti]|uniref:Putative restriction endonuclease domain-containing protein n=1 Tax=Geodia barretti TaxID=519541 RepID=A0AA35SF52_GEOBA|nr:hypothetical protein GBAR_LOCUS15935 [Geodia barretti]
MGVVAVSEDTREALENFAAKRGDLQVDADSVSEAAQEHIAQMFQMIAACHEFQRAYNALDSSRYARTFVIELRSSSDSLTDLRAKMEEYMNNGARLGWLIDPLADPKLVYIYRPQAQVEVLEDANSVSGEPELPGFTLDLTRIWDTPT